MCAPTSTTTSFGSRRRFPSRYLVQNGHRGHDDTRLELVVCLEPAEQPRPARSEGLAGIEREGGCPLEILEARRDDPGLVPQPPGQAGEPHERESKHDQHPAHHVRVGSEAAGLAAAARTRTGRGIASSAAATASTE